MITDCLHYAKMLNIRYDFLDKKSNRKYLIKTKSSFSADRILFFKFAKLSKLAVRIPNILYSKEDKVYYIVLND